MAMHSKSLRDWPWQSRMENPGFVYEVPTGLAPAKSTTGFRFYVAQQQPKFQAPLPAVL